MANPTVEKLKVFGLRHGEKVAMGVVAVVFAYCAYSSWSHPSIEETPDQVKRSAALATSNIQKNPNADVILAKLEESGVKLEHFEKKVVAMQSSVADVSKFRLARSFVKPEPGAGLIRDTPELLAPTQIYAHSGRGAVRVLATDAEGNLIPKDAEEEKGGRRPRGARGARIASSKKDAEKEKEEKDAAARLRKGVVGAEEKADEKAEETAEKPSNAEYKDALHGYRWVALVGKLDHAKQKELYAKALKVESANPNYLRLDVERQELNSDGSWADWTQVDRKPYEDVKKVLTKEEKEFVPADARIDTLVDVLPFLEVGYWVGAHHGSLVPKEVMASSKTAATKKAATRKAATGGMAAFGSSNMNSGMNMPSNEDYMAQMGSMSMMPMQGGVMPGGRNIAEGDFQKTDAEWVMIPPSTSA